MRDILLIIFSQYIFYIKNFLISLIFDIIIHNIRKIKDIFIHRGEEGMKRYSSDLIDCDPA